jgi:hypothetical protein
LPEEQPDTAVAVATGVVSDWEGVVERDVRSDSTGLVHAVRLLALGAASGGFPPCGVVRTEFQPLLALGGPELAGAAAEGTRAGARKSASFPSGLPVAKACERRFAGTRVSMRRINCTLR